MSNQELEIKIKEIIAIENMFDMILAAKDMGIGSAWLVFWPQMVRVKAQAQIFGLPETIIPHSIIAFGYPAEEPKVKAPEWEADRIHYEQW